MTAASRTKANEAKHSKGRLLNPFLKREAGVVRREEDGWKRENRVVERVIALRERGGRW